MGNTIKWIEIIEGNLKAVKDTDDFGGCNMWNLYIKTRNGYWESVQWMNRHNIQQFFNAELPVYSEAKQTSNNLS